METFFYQFILAFPGSPMLLTALWMVKISYFSLTDRIQIVRFNY